MARTRLYAIIYVVLFVMATAQVVVEFEGLLETQALYWIGFGIIIVLSLVKAVIVAGYYQHLRWEPRSLSYLIGIGLLAALALTIASSYSIT
jgi:cytochrome c oxidase subunit 4